jgi:CIC family chloride channel protein
MIIVPEAYVTETGEAHSLADMVHQQAAWLLPQMTVREAAVTFDHAEAESLAVVDSPVTRRVIGLLSEAHALRRYAEESDRRRRDLLGDT